MSQRTLFDLDPPDPTLARGRLDPDSEAFLSRYREHYCGERTAGAIRGETSKLRSVVREAARSGGGTTLSKVLTNTSMLARVLTAPSTRPSATTALIRLGAIHAAPLLLSVRRRVAVASTPSTGRSRAERRQSGTRAG